MQRLPPGGTGSRLGGCLLDCRYRARRLFFTRLARSLAFLRFGLEMRNVPLPMFFACQVLLVSSAIQCPLLQASYRARFGISILHSLTRRVQAGGSSDEAGPWCLQSSIGHAVDS